jgi:amino acid transporter
LKVAVRAKNAAAVIFIAMQTGAVLLLATVFRVYVSRLSVTTGIAASAVVTVYLIAVGNLTSVRMARPVDPAQTFKKQAGAKMQLWLLACGVGMYVLVGFAFLAQWALRSDAALLGILLLEFVIGLIVYKIATDSAIEHGLRGREQLVETLSKGVSPISAG